MSRLCDRNIYATKSKWILPADYDPKLKARKSAIIDYSDYQLPVTQLKGQKGNGYSRSQYMVTWAVDRFKRNGR